MNRRHLIVVISAVVALAAALTASAATPVLRGTVGPGFTIKLAKKPTRAGRYTFVIVDKASIHNFHLVGPGVSKKITGISFVGTKRATVSLKKGVYRFYCDLHPSLRGSFKIS